MAIGDIPGLGAYLQRRQMNEMQPLNELKQVSGVMDLVGVLQKREQAEAVRGILAQSPDIAAAIPALMKAGPEGVQTANVLAQITEKLNKRAPTGQAIGAGGFLKDDGTVIPPAARPPDPTKPPNVRQRFEGENVIQEERQPDGTWKEIGRGPRFAKSVGPTIVNPAPVTPVTLQDPNNPNETIVIDGRTRQVLGKGPKLTDTGKLEQKRQFNMQGIGATIQSAENILNGKNGDPLPTGSGFGTAVDYAASLVGVSPSGASQADQLRALGGALTAKMPRMEGPQSDKDVALYREMAARVGDSMLPIKRRKEALETVKELWAKYERLNPDAFAGAAPTTPPTAGGVPAGVDPKVWAVMTPQEKALWPK